MKKLVLVLFLFLIPISSYYCADNSSLYLSLDLGEESYTFGLSSNPITSVTPQPTDTQVKLEPVNTDNGYIGVIGNVYGNTNNNELHFYWNIASPKSFSVYVGVDGPLNRTNWSTGQENQELDWTVSVDEQVINKDNYNNKCLLYTHNPENGRNAYSSKEIIIYTEPVDYGIYGGNLIFTIQEG